MTRELKANELQLAAKRIQLYAEELLQEEAVRNQERISEIKESFEKDMKIFNATAEVLMANIQEEEEVKEEVEAKEDSEPTSQEIA